MTKIILSLLTLLISIQASLFPEIDKANMRQAINLMLKEIELEEKITQQTELKETQDFSTQAFLSFDQKLIELNQKKDALQEKINELNEQLSDKELKAIQSIIAKLNASQNTFDDIKKILHEEYRIYKRWCWSCCC